MSILLDSKFLLGVAGAATSAAVLGFIVKQFRCKDGEAQGTFVAKSNYEGAKGNPVLDYLLKNALRESESLTKLREATLTLSDRRGSMLCAPEEAQMFRLILKLMNAKKVIEIGMFTAYNTVSMAMALPPDGKVVACDVTDEHFQEVNAQKFLKEAGVDHKVDIKIQPALQTLDDLLALGEAGSYDFVFIDADKTGYDAYYERALQLLRVGGLIAIDNVFWGGKVFDMVKHADDNNTVALHKLNQKVHSDSRVVISMLPFADGVTLVMKI